MLFSFNNYFWKDLYYCLYIFVCLKVMNSGQKAEEGSLQHVVNEVGLFKVNV